MRDLLRTEDLSDLADACVFRGDAPEYRARPRPTAEYYLPYRGEEMVAEVIGSPGPRVFQQAANRLPLVRAVQRTLFVGELRDRAVQP